MSDDERVYSDEEFALILRKAQELASRTDGLDAAGSGLTLTDMQAAATQVGLDPTFIAQAARALSATRPSSPLERLLGGPTQHDHEARLPIPLDEARAARLLSAVRISGGLAGSRDSGHSSALGMTWRDGGDMEALRVTARAAGRDTVVSVVHDRRGTLAVVTTTSAMATFLAVLFATFALYPEAPALGAAGLVAGVGGVLAVARGYWRSSTRKVRERIDVVMDAIGETMTATESQSAEVRPLGEGVAVPEVEPGPSGTRK